MEEPDHFEVDFLMLADRAEAVGGKLYMLGGAWDRIHIPVFPGPPMDPFSVAVGITVPWALTNHRFVFGLELLNVDGVVIGEQMRAEMEAGRPPGIRPGVHQRVVLAVNARPEFPEPGRYTFAVSLDDKPMKGTSFEVAQAQEITLAPPSQ